MKNRKTAMLIGGTLVVLAMFVGCGEHAGEKEYNKALSAWDKGDLVLARSLLEKSIRKSSGSEQKSIAWNQLGLILWELDEVDAAADAFSKSCNLTESLTGANLNLGLALLHGGKLAEAEVALNNVLGDDPDNATARASLATIDMQQRNWSEAAKDLALALKARPRDPAGHNALALTELHLNRNSEAAISRLKQVYSAFPDYLPAAYNLAVIYDQWQGNRSAAVSWYEQYLKKAEPGVRSDMARKALARLGRKTTSSTAGSTQTDSESAARYIAEGSKCHAAKDYKGAIEQYRKAIQADPKQKTAYYNMGLASYAMQNYGDAVNSCETALRLDPKFADARYMLALSLAQQKKWSEAEKEAHALKELNAARGQKLLQYIEDARRK